MNWDDKGYLISKSKYNENSLIAEFFTQDHGKTSGIIFGGTSKKIKIIYKLVTRFTYHIIQSLRTKLDILKSRLSKPYHHSILITQKNSHVLRVQ